MADAPDPTPTPDPTPDAGGSPDGKTFTQADLDRIVADRLTRERQKYADYDDLKTKASQFDELQDAQKSELERERERAAQAESARAEAEKRARDALTRSAILAAAAGKVVDPDAAVRLIDVDALVFDDAGLPTNAGDLVAQLVESKPYLAAEPKVPAAEKPADQGGHGSNGAITREDLKSMSPEEIVQAKAEGRLNHLLAGS